MNKASMPGSSKSSSAVIIVRLDTGDSPRAINTARAVARIVPPTQKPSALTCFWPMISYARCIALIATCSMYSSLEMWCVTRVDEQDVAISDGVANKRIFRLQIEDVVLVDARWHQ